MPNFEMGRAVEPPLLWRPSVVGRINLCGITAIAAAAKKYFSRQRSQIGIARWGRLGYNIYQIQWPG